jgi:hypothetical protein
MSTASPFFDGTPLYGRQEEQGLRGRRRAALVAGSALMVVAAIAGIVVSIVNYQRAEEWSDRSEAWETRAVASGELAEELGSQLSDSQTESALRKIALETSEADRDALQSRIDGLANEKASAEDRQRVAEGERDSAVYVASLAGTAAIDARQCLDDVEAALSAIIDYYSTAYVDSLIDRAVASCAASDGSYSEFATAVGRL